MIDIIYCYNNERITHAFSIDRAAAAAARRAGSVQLSWVPRQAGRHCAPAPPGPRSPRAMLRQASRQPEGGGAKARCRQAAKLHLDAWLRGKNAMFGEQSSHGRTGSASPVLMHSEERQRP